MQQLEKRCIEELANCIYNFLHEEDAEKIYPPDEYDSEAKSLYQLLSQGGSISDSSELAAELAKIFSHSFGQEYSKDTFGKIAPDLRDIYDKYIFIAQQI